METQVEFKNQSMYLKNMAAGIVESVKEEEKQKVFEEDQKRKVKDDLCKDCGKIHSIQSYSPLTCPHKCEYCA
jgi:Fe2+ or Zn2+ uptake regulation protein